MTVVMVHGSAPKTLRNREIARCPDSGRSRKASAIRLTSKRPISSWTRRFTAVFTSSCRRGSIHYRRAQYVQRREEDKAHRNGRRVSRGSAGNMSKLAFEGFGAATRAEKNHSPCTFRNEKRSLRSEYYVQHRRPVFCSENLQVLVGDDGQRIAVKVPECAERNTCTLSSLIRLHAELGSTEHQLSECSPHRTEAVPPIINEGSLRL